MNRIFTIAFITLLACCVSGGGTGLSEEEQREILKEFLCFVFDVDESDEREEGKIVYTLSTDVPGVDEEFISSLELPRVDLRLENSDPNFPIVSAKKIELKDDGTVRLSGGTLSSPFTTYLTIWYLRKEEKKWIVFDKNPYILR